MYIKLYQLVIRFFKTSNLSNFGKLFVMDKPLQKDEFENLKKVLDRKTKEFEIIKQISSQINKTMLFEPNIKMQWMSFLGLNTQ